MNGIERLVRRALARRFPQGLQTGEERRACGRAASVVGIGVNALLFAFKLAVGLISGSVAIMADAVNNLSDASSSAVSLLGFYLSGRPADAEHPYGHGRYEYLSGLMVAVMILVIGVETLKGSVEKIFAPEAVAFHWGTVAVLMASIAAKLCLAAFNRAVGRQIDAKPLLAAADDSRNDVLTTAAVLAGTVIAHFTGWQVDGYMGAGVAAFILVSGFGLVRETLDPLLGALPSAEQVQRIRERILSYPGVLGVHDLMLHDYGPGRQFASVHVEMSAAEEPLVSHEVIDRIEQDFRTQEGLHLVVHYDPVAVDDPRLPVWRAAVAEIVREIHPDMTIHDLRIVPRKDGANLVFDCIVPYGCTLPREAIRARVNEAVERRCPGCRCVMTLERSFVASV